MGRRVTAPGSPAKPLSAAEAARIMHLGPGTVRKYCTTGVKLGGHIVRLQCDFVGESYQIWPQWIEDFKQACKAARTAGAPEPSPRPISDEEATRQQAADLADILNM